MTENDIIMGMLETVLKLREEHPPINLQGFAECAAIFDYIATLKTGTKIGNKVLEAQWQPIETAPKDETEILGFFPSCSVTGMIKAMYWDNVYGNWASCETAHEIMNTATAWRPLLVAPSGEGVSL